MLFLIIRATLLAAFKYTIACGQLESPCYPEHSQDLFMHFTPLFHLPPPASVLCY